MEAIEVTKFGQSIPLAVGRCEYCARVLYYNLGRGEIMIHEEDDYGICGQPWPRGVERAA